MVPDIDERADLVIGYGNTLRGDDALGRLVADSVDSWNLPGVKSVSCHQLTPELAADIAAARRVIFVDAGLESGLKRLIPSELAPPATHRAEPGDLLALSTLLYGTAPDAYLLTVEANDFELGADLSEAAKSALPGALSWLKTMLCESSVPSTTR